MPTITDQIGRVLQGRYRIEAALGTGSSAHVYLAVDLELAREVAVKLLHPGLTNDEAFLRRFRAEAQAAAALNHPNIVQVYDWGEDHGEPFLVLAYLAGGSLRDLLDRGVYLGPAEVAKIGAQAARGLEYAHRRGLVHRDIKPANLLLDDDGVVHVADFGLARALADAAWTEPAGAVFGTARYASPEQVSGKRVDERSDVYSLALVCYEAIVGRAPFRSETTLGSLIARVNQPLPSSPALGPLAPILAAAAISEPLARPDAGAFASDLELLLSTLPRPARLPIERPFSRRVAESVVEEPLDVPSFIGREDTIAMAPVIADEPEEDGDWTDDLDDDGWERRPRRRGRILRPLLVLGLVALLIAAGIAAYARFDLYGHKVPQLVGGNVAHADAAAQAAGLRIGATTTVFSTRVGSGLVVSESPAAGTRLKADAPVNLVISRGHAPVGVPTLTSLTRYQAHAALDAQGFGERLELVYDETVATGRVIASNPSTGNAAYGSTIVVKVSKGPHPRTIPNLVGLLGSAGSADLRALRLISNPTLAYSNTVPTGDIISTSPAAGTTGVAVGATVNLVVSQGPQLVAVPSVSGDTIATAVSALQAAGLTVTEQVGPPFATSATTTDPAPGIEVRPGSDVTLYVA